MPSPILLIDDEETFAQMLQELLQASGYASDYCLDPAEAIELLGRGTYKLVITDYKMPQMDGSEFLKQARKLNPDLPVIMVSGLMNMSELIKVANIGVTLVLEKPFRTEELLEHVARFVKSGEASSLSEQARNEEASEVNLQVEQVPVTFPTPTKFFSDQSNDNRRFLEAFWRSANQCRHLSLKAHPGAEIRPLAAEIMDWTGQDQGSEVVRIDLQDAGADFTRNWIEQTEPFPAVLVVDLRDADWTDDILNELGDWIHFLESSGRDLSLARILYVLPAGASFDPYTLPVDEAYRPFIGTECPVLLPLRDRVPDVAFYLSQLLDTTLRERLGPELCQRILLHDWPGDYQQLQTAANALKTLLEEKQAAGAAEAVAVLSEAGIDLPESGAVPMKTFLLRRQREYLLLHQKDGEALETTLTRLGVEELPCAASAILEDKELVYPELLDQSEGN